MLMDAGNAVVLSLLLAALYATAVFMFYIFFRHGYPTAYTLNDEGIRIQYRKRSIAFIPYQIIEGVTFDQEGPNLGKAMADLGSFKDFTARKSEKYVLVETPFCTYYLSPSNPDKFKLEFDNHTKNAVAPSKELFTPDAFRDINSGSVSDSLKSLFLLLFVKFPVGQMLVGLLIVFGLSLLGYPLLAYSLSIIFILSLNLAVYFFSSSIGSQLLGSHTSDSVKIQSVIDSLKNKIAGPLPKIEVANPVIKGLNAFAAGPSPSRSVVILTRSIEDLPQNEIEAIVAHELGHIRHWHSLKLTLLSFFVIAFGFAVESTALVLVFLPLSLLAVSFISKIFEKDADLFAARITEPIVFSSVLQKVGENAAYRIYTLGLTLSNPKPIEEIRETVGLKAPKNFVKRASLWIFSSHPPIYYRLRVMQEIENKSMIRN
jgi:heat shock protein HtpX